jgi:hypothetical protein
LRHGAAPVRVEPRRNRRAHPFEPPRLRQLCDDFACRSFAPRDQIRRQENGRLREPETGFATEALAQGARVALESFRRVRGIEGRAKTRLQTLSGGAQNRREPFVNEIGEDEAAHP